MRFERALAMFYAVTLSQNTRHFWDTLLNEPPVFTSVTGVGGGGSAEGVAVISLFLTV